MCYFRLAACIAGSQRFRRNSHPISKMSRIAKATLFTVVLSFFGALFPAHAQEVNQGPMPAPPKYEAKRIPAVPHPGPPPIPVETIIQKFAANEDIAQKVYDNYTFLQTIRIEELSNPGGKFTVLGESYLHPDGQRFFRVLKPAQSDLKFTSYTLEDVHAIISHPLFFLTSDEIANYNFLYAGQFKLDELNTYVFQVKPKMLSRNHLLFQGVIYVDDHDLAVVETYGKFVSEIPPEEGSKLPFTMFDVYRENFQDKYWLPTYISSDDYVTTKDSGDLHIRLVVHSTDFKLSSAAQPAPASPAPQPSAPAAPAPQAGPPSPSAASQLPDQPQPHR